MSIPAISQARSSTTGGPGKQHCIVFVCLARQMLASISLMVLVERGWWSIVSVAAVAGRAKRIPRSCISRSGTGIRHRVRVGLTPIRRRGHERTNERTNEQANERTSEYEHIRRVCPSVHIGPCLSLPLAVWRTSGSRSVQTPHYCEQCTRGINARARSLGRSYTCQVARHVRAHCTHDRNTFFPSFFPCGGSKTRRVGPCDKNDLFHPPTEGKQKKSWNLWRPEFSWFRSRRFFLVLFPSRFLLRPITVHVNAFF